MITLRDVARACLPLSPTHALCSNLVNTMQKLKEAALQTPEGFYHVSGFGAPLILFGFLFGSLHNNHEDFGLDRGTFDPGSKAEDELLDWWDVLYWLKQGLLDSAIQSDRQSTALREMMSDVYGADVDSIQSAAEHEFQLLMCRTYSNQTLTVKEAWELVKLRQYTQNTSNEYSGENILHILIVHNHTAKYNLPWHLDILFNKFVTKPQFRLNLMTDKVSPAQLHVCSWHITCSATGGWTLLLPGSWRSRGLGADAVALCCVSGLPRCGQNSTSTLPK
jgi:hypothetical protein